MTGGYSQDRDAPEGQSQQHQYSIGHDPRTQAGLEVANPRSPNQDKYWIPPASADVASSVKPDVEPPVVQLLDSPEKRIWGMRRTTFILSALIALISIVAGVVGGVAGSIAVSEAKKCVGHFRHLFLRHEWMAH